jgi:hypothetical protein
MPVAALLILFKLSHIKDAVFVLRWLRVPPLHVAALRPRDLTLEVLAVLAFHLAGVSVTPMILLGTLLWLLLFELGVVVLILLLRVLLVLSKEIVEDLFELPLVVGRIPDLARLKSLLRPHSDGLGLSWELVFLSHVEPVISDELLIVLALSEVGPLSLPEFVALFLLELALGTRLVVLPVEDEVIVLGTLAIRHLVKWHRRLRLCLEVENLFDFLWLIRIDPSRPLHIVHRSSRLDRADLLARSLNNCRHYWLVAKGKGLLAHDLVGGSVVNECDRLLFILFLLKARLALELGQWLVDVFVWWGVDLNDGRLLDRVWKQLIHINIKLCLRLRLLVYLHRLLDLDLIGARLLLLLWRLKVGLVSLLCLYAVVLCLR